MREKNERTDALTQDEQDRLHWYIEQIRQMNEDLKKTDGKQKTYYTKTYGCQMNAHDSEKLSGMLEDMGYVEASGELEADFIIYNTCCIRENAENKVFGNLGVLKNRKIKNPEMKIALCGCMMQQDIIIEKLQKSYRFVDIIFGTFNLHHFPQMVYTNWETGKPVIDIWKDHKAIVEDLPSIREKKYKASVNITYGCNNFCSYCIVPYVRGRERSRNMNDIVNEIKSLVQDGAVEILLLGQNVNSYGQDLADGVRFPELLQAVDQIEGIQRIRFMTSHPKDLSPELIQVMKEAKHICRHLHLPMQSGSTEVLKKMNRKYTKESYLSLVHQIRKAIPDIALTTDIIVGFPGETERDFENTLDVVQQVEFTNAYTFLYSKRTGTPAAAMEGQIPENVAMDRFNRLLETLTPISYKLAKKHIGMTLAVLVEDINGSHGDTVTGRADDNAIVHFKGNPSLVGKIVNVKITGCKTFYLTGEMV